MTKQERLELINNYVDCVLNGMDTQTMEIMIAEMISGNLQDYNDEQLETVVRESYPHLLGEE